ncbi:serine hydrolase domain-containing protein [Nocardia blacklockiae]|uniref:serine hydrolase domain-containing protein n=1 Tax=Nocardia blacklockiae TaxID=480036 RepID=UPI0018937F7C|nr:serine hydrolase [Nocardia blacklockiae]MBF6169882.1 serine hydrolase [Nocardia blacklockiae]
MLDRTRTAAACLAFAAVFAASPAPAAANPLPLLPHLPFYPTTEIAPSNRPVALTGAARPVEAAYTYRGERGTTSDFLDRTSTRGYLVVHHDSIIDERYFAGYTAASHFNSWSVGKSITATAVGAAVAEGRIGSVDDPVTAYVPLLKGTGYDGVSIRDVLHMASGHRYDETEYTDPTKGSTATTIRMVLGTALSDQAREARRDEPPGTRWNYDSLNTFVLGRVVAEATGKSLASYVQDKIWQPAGMEAPALVGHDYQGNDIGYCCFHATARDFARFGLLYLHDGRVDERQVLPRQWVYDATHSTEPYLQPHHLVPGKPDSSENTYGYGYGYQWWLGDGDRGDYLAIGILGQYVYVSPADDLVIVKTSEDLDSERNLAEAVHAFRAVADAVGADH